MAWQTLQNLYDDVRYRTGTGTTPSDTTVVSDATLLRLANKWFSKIFGAMVETGEDMHAEISIFDLVANQREYTIPVDSTTTPFGGGGGWKILRLELKIDGNNWRVATPISMRSQNVPYNETDIVGSYNSVNPHYYLLDNSYFILSGTISAVTGGGRIFWVKRPAEMTATTDVLASTTWMLNKEFMDVLSYGMSSDIFERFGQITQQQNALGLYEAGIERMKRQLTKRAGEDIFHLKSRFTDYT